MEKCKAKLEDCRKKMDQLEKDLEKAYAEENDILIKKYTKELEQLTSMFETFKKCSE
ncbi:hypothetical protein [uncultured Ilyobacter sp.]|uniref:hypothetical protein n=1 Tax=uncultured Ilyobacter sp. TaxID=544433 RepID=UPI0029C83001|nr:hypothetical protein [uncultured Ilyobacter sp.]